ncbi:hypothetical protein D9M71_616640 [compost metagenome]
MHAQRERDVLEHIEVGEQRPALEQHAHLLARVEQVTARQRRQVLPGNPDLTAGRAQLRAHQAEQRGLAATRWPHDTGDLAARDANVDVAENAARTAFEGNPLQLDRVGAIHTHLDSLLMQPRPNGRRPPSGRHTHP